METKQIIAELAKEIARLQQARALLSDWGGSVRSGKKSEKTGTLK